MKALIAMSGGVDSSAAALLIKEKGYDAMGAIMHLLGERNKDADAAKDVCDKIGIPFYEFDFSEEFSSCVIKSFVESYESGATPNPCIECNRHLKFGKFVDAAKELGCTNIATGHYAKIERCGNDFLLKKAKDVSKDQSYVLYSIKREMLSEILLPLGEYTKEEIREIAASNGFINAHKKDSQDICFVPDGNYKKVISSLSNKTYPEGDFVNLKGEVLGKHKGIIGYTIGQRKGLGLALPAPMYVCEKKVEKNEVVLCSNEELFTRDMKVKNVNWLASDKIPDKIKARVKIRYKHEEQPAEINFTEDGAFVKFDDPQRAISKGQAAVFYDGDTVLGGGTID
ncbi:MAG: tRNA 2-thiouridine(34) synthase MnmA [Clostridia bacterium]|nr:tRNA 2-thiouridine(34) synthase MnmA [Clostridia bacterium]